MQQIVIGLVGPISSGKGDLAKHLVSLNFTCQSLSDRVREELALRNGKSKRETLQDVGDDLRKRFGNQVLAERTVDLLSNVKGNIVFDSIRNPGEIAFLKKVYPNIIIIGVDAPIELRLRWYLTRAKERREDHATPEDFFRANARDHGVVGDDSGQQVNQCLEMSSFVIQNIGSKQDLLDTLDIFLFEELGFNPEGARRWQEKK